MRFACLYSAVVLLLLAQSLPASANDWAACNEEKDTDRRLHGCTRIIQRGKDTRANLSIAYVRRCWSYNQRSMFDLALTDCTEAIRLTPSNNWAYINRCWTYQRMGDADSALLDCNQAIKLKPHEGDHYVTRCGAYIEKGDYDLAIADCRRGINLGKDTASARDFLTRALELKEAQELAKRAAEAAQEEAAERARKAAEKAQQEAADLKIKHRIEAEKRIAAEVEAEKQRKEAARLAELLAKEKRVGAGRPVLPPTDRRIALVIGNSSYKEVGPLNNPGNDARAVAGAFRRLGFALVREHFDLDLRSLTGALKEFGDLAIEASWAVIYYAGHGIEMDGVSYVIPTDAKLLRDVHILDETVPLHHLLAKVEPAGKLRLVILDACRTNPFVSRMVRTGGLTRSLGRGLAHIEPAAGVLVAYSAKHGTLAADGPGKHSPFAEAGDVPRSVEIG